MGPGVTLPHKFYNNNIEMIWPLINTSQLQVVAGLSTLTHMYSTNLNVEFLKL